MTEQKAGLEIFVHPLVVVNISDHFTREKCIHKNNARVFGVLLGQQEGRRVEISNSFEMLLVDGQIDPEFMTTRQDQFFRVFEKESCEILGWYSTGAKITDGDIHIHEQLETYNESPLYLLLNNEHIQNTTNQGELALTVFESIVKIVEAKPVTSFNKLTYSIATTEIERIAVDHVAHDTSGVVSQFASHATTLHQSIKMLHVRISVLKQYLEAVKAGKLPADQSLLRDINSVCQQLPAIDSGEFNEAFFTEYNDALLLTYMAAITKASSATNEMLEKFNATQDRQFRKRGMF
jgi:COP9 signalosome complex subunit 6